MTDNEARAALSARQESYARVHWGGPRDNEHMPFRGHRTVAEIDELRRLREAGL